MTQSSEPSGTRSQRKRKPLEHFRAGEEVIVKRTGERATVWYVVALGEEGHNEIRHYLKGDSNCHIYYTNDLKRAPKRKINGWGKTCKNG